jgi:PKD repeat protein
MAESTTSGKAPLTVGFAATNYGGPVTSWLWTFGDGGTSNAQNPTHVYTQTGTFTTSVVAKGPGGTSGQSVRVTVTAAPPVPGFTTNTVSGKAPLNVQFTNTSTGAITSNFWTFGDGSTSPLTSPSHAYTKAGTFTAYVTATGPAGSVKSSSVTINVSGASSKSKSKK